MVHGGRFIAAGLVTLAALGTTAARGADGDCYVVREATATKPEVRACEQSTWLAAGSQRLGTAVAADPAAMPSWDTTKPTATFHGGGAAYPAVRLADIVDTHNPAYRPTFAGTYTGVLDNMAVTLYLSSPVYQNIGAQFPLLTRLVVDGEVVYERTSDQDVLNVPMQRAPVSSVRFLFTNLHAALETLRVPNLPGTEHDIAINVAPYYWGDSAATAVLFDAADVPSGIVFNKVGNLKPYTAIDTTQG